MGNLEMIGTFVIGGMLLLTVFNLNTQIMDANNMNTLTLMSQPIHRAVGTSALFGLLISVPGTIGFIINGWGDPRLPAGNLGYVNLIGFALISPMTVLFAPLGAKIAHQLGKRQLSLAFGVFLLVVSVRMLSRVF